MTYPKLPHLAKKKVHIRTFFEPNVEKTRIHIMAFFGRVNQLVRGLTAAMIQQKKGKRIGN